jgi:hypothetical protein
VEFGEPSISKKSMSLAKRASLQRAQWDREARARIERSSIASMPKNQVKTVGLFVNHRMITWPSNYAGLSHEPRIASVSQ